MHATTRRIAPRPWLRPRGFTLIELLVVIAIIGLISAVALPVVLPALNERRVSEGARILQAALAGVRDSAIKANAPRGLRFLPDPVFDFNSSKAGEPLASNRFIPIEPAPDYSEGVVQVIPATVAGATGPISNPLYNPFTLQIAEQGYSPDSLGNFTILNAPTGWKYNIRQGDKLRFNDSGSSYTIAGPINGLTAQSNPERYISFPTNSPADAPNASSAKWIPEYLFLTNGVDDDGDGWVDESCDGIDNDGDGIIDPGFNGIDDDGDGTVDNAEELGIGIDSVTGKRSLTAKTEFEQEVFVGTLANTTFSNENYTISRRPVVSPGGAETTLPAGVVIDLTTWNAGAIPLPKATAAVPYPAAYLPERSRLPVNPFNGYVDIMLDQTGRVVSPGAGTGTSVANANSPLASLPFYHFWIADREDVVAPLHGSSTTSGFVYPVPNPDYSATTPHVNFLPMPQGTIDSGGNAYAGPYLKGERRLVTLFTKTGQIVSNSIELFNESDTSTPYYAPQSGVKESQ